MARFASSGLGKRSALLGTPSPRKVFRIVGALAMTYGSPTIRNLARDAGGTGPVTAYATTGVSYTRLQSLVTNGGNKYIARVDMPAPAGAFNSSNWEQLYNDYAEAGVSYTAKSSIVVHGGVQYMATANISAPAGAFNPTQWQRLFYYGECKASWLDHANANWPSPQAVSDVLTTAHPQHQSGQYNYLTCIDPNNASSRYGMQERQWLIDNSGWATVSGNGDYAAITRNGTCTPGSAVVTGLSATGDLAVGMLVTGTGVDVDENRVMIKSIDSGSQITLGRFSSPWGDQSNWSLMSNYTGVTASGSTSIKFEDAVWGEHGHINSTFRNVNVVNSPKDSEGLNYSQWVARQMGLVGTLTNVMPKVARHCLDDTTAQEEWSTGGGDYINYDWQRRNIYGVARWDGTNIDPSNMDPERQAHYQFKVDFFRALRRYHPGSRVWINGAGAGGLPALWRKEIDYAMMESVFGGSGAGDTQDGSASGVTWWKQIVNHAAQCNDYCNFRNGSHLNTKSYRANGSSVTSQPIHKAMLFGLCTALLTDSEYSFRDDLSVNIEARDRFWMGEYDIALGSGVEPVIDPDVPWTTVSSISVWRREFEAGWVFCNPRQLAGAGNWDTATYYATFTLPFDAQRPPGCLNPNSDASLGGADGEVIAAGTSITMHARSGLILLKV